MERSWILTATVRLPALLALVSGLLAVWITLPRARSGGADRSLPWRSMAVVGLVAGLLLLPILGSRAGGPDVVSGATALTLVAVLGWFPLVALFGGTEDPGRLVRGLWIALAAIGLLVVAESFQRTFGVSRTLVLQAVDQVGEVRLADVRAGLQDPLLSRSLWIQLLLVFPFFVLIFPVLVPGGPLLWPVGLIPILQYLWTAPAGLVVTGWSAWRPREAGPLAVLALAIAVHPLLLDKSSWDFIPPGLLLFLLAWHLERTGSRWRFALVLGLASWSHPSQAVMAALWAADHARRNWAAEVPAHRRRLLWVPAIAWGMAAIPILSMLIPALWHPESALMHHLAPYARRRTAAYLQGGDFRVLGWMAISNLSKIGLLLSSLGLVPVLRRNRFLAYGVFEVAYSLFTSNGFIHGSLPGCLGLLGCATLENANHLSPERLRRSAGLAAVLLLPLTLWWSPQHVAVQLLRNPTVDRLAGMEALITPEDRDRTCVGQATTYTVLAGHCRGEGVLRLPDGRPGANARDGDVYLLDLSPPPWPQEPGALREWIKRPRFLQPEQGAIETAPLDFQGEPIPEDLAWLREGLVSGAWTLSRNEGGRIRLDRIERSESPGAVSNAPGPPAPP
ncbi:MAG TPA: hypothetical protein PLQ97_11565 [Myxococcota bacterium]|nr:hypothetical protein [Myxococcota bacterium]HQK51755.1 hypothetical protein [Myxococcota bacterium]